MKTLFIGLLIVAGVASASEHFTCGQTLDIHKLSEARAEIEKLSYLDTEYYYSENGNHFIGDKRSEIYKNFLEECLNKQLVSYDLEALSSADLYDIFDLIRHVNFYYQDPRLVKAMELIVLARQRRGDIVSNLLTSLHKAYIRGRAITEARQLEKRYPELQFTETLPLIKNISAERGFLELDDNRQSILYRKFEFGPNGHVVVVSSPMCSPSKRFLSWLNALNREMYKAIFSRFATFVSPPGDYLHIESYHAANKEIAPIKLHYIYNKDQWPEIQLWNTPVFYFFYDGKLVSQLIGWPEEGREVALTNALKAVKLL